MAAASSTEVPPNFITATSSPRSNLLCRLLMSNSTPYCSQDVWRKEKPTARSLLAVGSVVLLKIALLHPFPSSRRHVIRVDMAVPVDVIRFAFWMRVFMKSGTAKQRLLRISDGCRPG
jgi:hypothetical protein